MAEAIILLQQGEVVAIPTETVYGLAADASNAVAIQKIFDTKQRPATNPLIVHLSSVAQVKDWAADFPPLAQRLGAAYWPGPLTLVLPAQPHVSVAVRAQQPTVALRVPAHPVASALIAASGLALAAPSANKYTQLSPTTADHVEQSLGMHVPVVDGGACSVGIESTIVSVSGDEWQLLRPGMIAASELADIAGKPALPLDILSPKAPGQHLLHYSPRTPCRLFDKRAEMQAYANEQPNCVALLIGEALSAPLTHQIRLNDAPQIAATQLYAALHTLDTLQAACILIESPPSQGLWAAIVDRLQRAAYRPAP